MIFLIISSTPSGLREVEFSNAIKMLLCWGDRHYTESIQQRHYTLQPVYSHSSSYRPRSGEQSSENALVSVTMLGETAMVHYTESILQATAT